MKRWRRRLPPRRGSDGTKFPAKSLSQALREAEHASARRRRHRLLLALAGGVVLAAGSLAARRAATQQVPPRPVLVGPLPSPTVIGITHDTRLPGWHLVWDDEFDSQALTNRLWTINSFQYPYNSQLQYYSASHVQVAHGNLYISVTPHAAHGQPYTSGMLTTNGTMAWKYGLLVIRAKLPADAGLFSAIWMLPAHAGKTVLPEVDIAEAKGSLPHHLVMTLHWSGPGRSIQSLGAPYNGPNFTTGFHTFSLKWTPTQLTWYVDGVARFTMTQHVPHVPMYLILNVAVGGAFPGSPLPTDHWPASMIVKYVRLYKPGNPPRPIPESIRPG